MSEQSKITPDFPTIGVWIYNEPDTDKTVFEVSEQLLKDGGVQGVGFLAITIEAISATLGIKKEYLLEQVSKIVLSDTLTFLGEDALPDDFEGGNA